MRSAPTLDRPPLQEALYRQARDPWRVAVACILLDRAARRQADAVHRTLFRRYPTSGRLAYGAEDGELEALLRPLGGAAARADTLRRMSHRWTVAPAAWQCDDVRAYPGLGEYAQDSHMIFVCGRVHLSPADRVLREWVRLLRTIPAPDRPAGYRRGTPDRLLATAS